jgi:hypothetical protein
LVPDTGRSCGCASRRGRRRNGGGGKVAMNMQVGEVK